MGTKKVPGNAPGVLRYIPWSPVPGYHGDMTVPAFGIGKTNSDNISTDTVHWHLSMDVHIMQFQTRPRYPGICHVILAQEQSANVVSCILKFNNKDVSCRVPGDI